MRYILAFSAFLTLTVAATASAQTTEHAADSVKLGLARDIVAAQGGQTMAEAKIKNLYSVMGKSMAQNMPADQAKLAQALQDDMATEMTAIIPAILDISVHTYADVFTEKELRDWLAFTQSDSGQAIVRKSPLVTQRALTEMMPLIFKMMPNIMQKTVDRVCAEQHCTPAQQQIVAAAAKAALPSQKS